MIIDHVIAHKDIAIDNVVVIKPIKMKRTLQNRLRLHIKRSQCACILNIPKALKCGIILMIQICKVYFLQYETTLHVLTCPCMCDEFSRTIHDDNLYWMTWHTWVKLQLWNRDKVIRASPPKSISYDWRCLINTFANFFLQYKTTLYILTVNTFSQVLKLGLESLGLSPPR